MDGTWRTFDFPGAVVLWRQDERWVDIEMRLLDGRIHEEEIEVYGDGEKPVHMKEQSVRKLMEMTFQNMTDATAEEVVARIFGGIER